MNCTLALLNLLSVMVNKHARAAYTLLHTGTKLVLDDVCVFTQTNTHTLTHTASAHLHSYKKQTAAQTSSSEAAIAC